ncbi:hypothetical protein [Rhodobacter sp. NSM]|uniref:hypothetical protein n=1 Tax=Rhodobacter sp. NSM TaxID=3457501 RepID=UPI003FCFC4F6
MIRVLVLRLLCLVLLAMAFMAGPGARTSAAERMAQDVMVAMPHAGTGSAPCCPDAGHDGAGIQALDCAASCATMASVLPDPVRVADRNQVRARHLPGWSRLPASRHPPPEVRPPRSCPAA